MQKHQWRPVRGGGPSRGVTDLSDSSSNQNPSPASSSRSINNSIRSSPAKADVPTSSSSLASSRPSSSSSASPVSSSFSSSSSSSSTAFLTHKRSPFIPYLPHDDAVAAGLGADQGGIDAVETQQVADILNEELGRLLKMQPLEFWKAVAGDNSIQVSLDSYLQFRRRWYDSQVDKPLAGVIVGDHELFRRIFMVLYRMSLTEENGVQSIVSEQPKEAIHQAHIFDIPRLLDICAIYGENNANLTRQLVKNAFTMNDKLYEDLASIVPIFSNTVHTMQQRCLLTLMKKQPKKDSEVSLLRIQKELLEVLDYLNDAVVSLLAFVDAYSEGAVALVLAGKDSESRHQILLTLALIHDSLIPTMHRSFLQLQGSSKNYYVDSSPEAKSVRLRLNLIDLAWMLLSLTYLQESEKEKSKSNVVTHLLETYIGNPRDRGEGLVQILSGMVEEPLKSSTEDIKSSGVLIRNIDKNHKLLDRVNHLFKQGMIFLDNVQYDYVEAIISYSNVAILSSEPEHVPVRTEKVSEVDVWNESKISHIKDILPDYGSGFIAACLDAYDNNPEEVIQRILEGTLHPTLQALDPTMEGKPVSLDPSVPVKDKGKGKVEEAPFQKKNGVSSSSAEAASNDMSRWQDEVSGGLAQRRFSSMAASSSRSNEDEDGRHVLPKSSDEGQPHKDGMMQGRFVRKDKGEQDVGSILDQRLPDDVLRTAAYASQYEDEYDDSFDDLGTSIADGVEETEILVDMSRSKSAVPDWRGAYQREQISTRGRSDGFHKGGWAVNNGGAPHTDAKSSAPRENNNKFSDAQRKTLPQTSRGRGRGRGRGRRDDAGAQFYVKDGMNFSYRVAGSVAVANAEEAEAMKRVERDTIHGLGKGGNVPLANDQVPSVHDRHNQSGAAGRGGGGAPNRGRGHGKKEHDHHNRKDRAMNKHFAGMGGM